MLLANFNVGSFDLADQTRRTDVSAIWKFFRELKVLFLVMCIVSGSPLAAQEPVAQEPVEDRFASKLNISEAQWKRGFHGLNLICMGVGLDHQSVRRWRRAPASETVLVVMGESRQSLLYNSINLNSYLNKGGSVLMASDTNSRHFLSGLGIQFLASDFVAENPEDFFAGQFDDCPVVTNIKSPVPLMTGIETLVTNRPGRLNVGPHAPWQQLAFLPPLVGSPNEKELFALAGETGSGGKLVCFADHSMFANQMLLQGDNAKAAKQSLEWLMGEYRKKVLVLVDGSVQAAVNPADLNVELPQPTREEVVDAISDLPPSAILEFANSVLGVVEEENMINDYIQAQMDQMHPKKVNRFLIFLAFAMACLFGVITYTWQKKIRRRTVSDIANYKARVNRKADKRLKKLGASRSKLSFERQMAALAMLDSFCLDIASRRFEDLPDFPEEIDIGSDEHGIAIKAAMKMIGSDYRSQPRDFWTEKRLLAVEGAVSHWRAYFESAMAVAQPSQKVVDAEAVK